ncbi:DUF4097 family beta strand repeat-containing protein [Hymenobacter jejuensis]|uniref:DUF4097 domain-containing protein n=1 Tax=Hymenobacter jejuensis TaxID=2502781 RepID=A0A5B8A1J5_9BACT|nr:hypothetical protein [Hymenobacter jejuensis]QDA60989.1 hypothetical protein FHG12_13135 [Hymenobacter jejuensis]
MSRFLSLIFLGLLLSVAQLATAQKVIEKQAPVKAGQRVFLNLKQATNIRVRSGSGSEVTVKASVTINQGKLNDALLLAVDRTGEEVTVASSFDEALLQTGQPSDCPGNGGTNWSQNKNGKSYSVCSDIQFEVTVPAGVALRINTISGNIEINGVTAPIEAKSISGFVDVSWPASQHAEVALKTITGEVYTDQEIAFVNRKENPGPVGYQVRGTLGGSGPLVKLESISNDIYFRKRK